MGAKRCRSLTETVSRTQSCRLAPSDCAISLILRKAWRIRASGSCTNVLVAGSTPCMPATKTKSPALAPRLHVPSALIAPGGLRVLTPFGEGACAKPTLDAMAIAVMQGKASRGNIWAPHLERLFDPPRRMRAGANGGQRTRANPRHKLDRAPFAENQQPSFRLEQF